MACSFQKEESVLIDMLMKIEPSARVFTIDTGVLFPETYEVWRKVEDRYDLHVEVFDASSMNGALDAGELLRAAQGGGARAGARRRRRLDHRHPPRAVAHARGRPEGRVDETRGVWKFNPLVDWTEEDVWRYMHEHDLPYNPLHDRGYDSIGCAPCTFPGTAATAAGPGRTKTECGLHV